MEGEREEEEEKKRQDERSRKKRGEKRKKERVKTTLRGATMISRVKVKDVSHLDKGTLAEKEQSRMF